MADDSNWQAALAALPANLREALVGNRIGDRALLQSQLHKALRDLDARIEPLVAAVAAHPALLALQARWRGLAQLAEAAGPGVSIRLACVTKNELQKDLAAAADLEDSWLWRQLHGALHPRVAEPFALLVGDDSWSIGPADFNSLQEITAVCAAAFCPLLTAPVPSVFALESWAELPAVRGLPRRFEDPRSAAWRSFRDTEEARFLVLALPRVQPAKAASGGAAGGASGGAAGGWASAAHALAARIAAAQAAAGWVADLDGAAAGTAEAALEPERAGELARLGFVPAVAAGEGLFFAAPRVAQKPKSYARPEPSADAETAARLAVVLCGARLAQALKIMAEAGLTRAPAARVEARLAGWLARLVGPEESHPLAEARVELKAVPGQRGVLGLALAWRPWLPGRTLHAPLRFTLPIVVG